MDRRLDWDSTVKVATALKTYLESEPLAEITKENALHMKNTMIAQEVLNSKASTALKDSQGDDLDKKAIADATTCPVEDGSGTSSGSSSSSTIVPAEKIKM